MNSVNVTQQSVTVDDGYSLNLTQCIPEGPYRHHILVLHGVVSHAGWLQSTARALAANNIAVTLMDRRGAGRNAGTRGDAPSTDVLLQDLAQTLDFLTAKLPAATTHHLCGFCWGANYAVNYLDQRADDRIASLLLLAPSLFPSQEMSALDIVVGDSSEPTEEPVIPIEAFTQGPLLEGYLRPDPLRLKKVSPRLNRCMQQFSQHLWMRFLRLDLPCCMILAEQDRVVDNASSTRLMGRFRHPDTRLLSFPAEHGIQFDAEDEIVGAMTDWLRTR